MRPEQPRDPERHHITRANGLKFAYMDEVGDAWQQDSGGPTLVAIPGLPGTARDFRWFSPALFDAIGGPGSSGGERLRLIRLDLPGYGESGRDGYHAMTIEQRAAVVLEFLDLLDLDQVILIGHSSGCTVAAELAVKHPERVSNVVFIAPPGPMPHYKLETYRWLNLLLLAAPTRTLMKPLLSFLFSRMGFPSYLSDDERIYSSLDAGVKNFTRHAHNLELLTQPTLVAWADDDRVIPPRFIEPLVARVPQGPRLHFDTGGHNLQKTRAIEIAEAMCAMLDLTQTIAEEE